MAHLIRGRLELTAKARDDLTGDIDELCYLTASKLQGLRLARAELERSGRSFRHRTYETEKAQLRSAEEVFSSYARDLRGWLQQARREDATVERLRQVRNEYADLLRLQQGIAAALTVGSDWQSPAFEYSGHPTAGRHSGSIREHLDDYKRDRHLQAREFEKSYLWEYLDIPPGLEMRALMTSCGMAAFTTILQFLCATVDRGVSVVAIRGMYHECRRLLTDSNLGSRVHWVDEANTSEIIDACRHLRPAALFLDSMCNSKSVAVPDLQTVMLELAASARRDVCVVIDNTCASIFCQPLDLAVLNSRVRPLLFESLTKYAQFGLDRAAAGMIVAPKREATALDGLREHLGTNVADVCASTIPEPNRALLRRRLRRIERNAQSLARQVMCCAIERTSPVTGAVYPGLEAHSCHDAASRLGFFGGFFAVEFRPEWDCPEVHRRLV